MKFTKPNLTQIITLILVIFIVVFHLIFYNTFEYHRDELLYFSLGTHPAAGYATTPPLIGWLAFLLIRIFGYSLFVVKLVPAFMSGAIILTGLMILLIIFTLPILPMGLPVYKPDRMVEYFHTLEEEMGMDVGRRWEDDSIHPLPQDYADMLGWEELTRITKIAYDSVTKKEGCIIYGENYGQAGAISIIGKKYGLPEAVSFHDSYRYWLPLSLEREITDLIYINDELGEDVAEMFSSITEVGRISNPYARESGTTVYLCREPVSSFNEFYYRILAERGIVD